MPKIIYSLPGGDRLPVDVAVGESVMRAAVDAGVPGIIGECGGSLSCATCHVHVPREWNDTFPAPGEDEADLLEIVDDLTANSRLGCQLEISEHHEGLILDVPSVE